MHNKPGLSDTAINGNDQGDWLELERSRRLSGRESCITDLLVFTGLRRLPNDGR